MDTVTVFFSVLLPQFPIYLIVLIGIALAISRWRKHPAVSRLTLIALSVWLVVSIVDTILSVWAPTLRDQGWTYSEITQFIMVKSYFSMFVRAIVWVLTLMAIFGWRGEQASVTSTPPPPPQFDPMPNTRS